MTKKGLALTLAVVMAWAVAVPAFGQANPFRDVPLDHWAYDAVETLVAAGLVEGYPDGTFGGERTFTRYEMAMVFARILARFEALLDQKIDARIGALASVEEVVLPDGTVGASIRLTPEMERAILELVSDPERAAQVAGATVRLAEEFAGELSLLGVRVAELERLFENVNVRLTAVEQQLAEIRSMAETARGVAEAANAAAQAAEDAAAEAQAKADWAWDLYERLKASGASDEEILEALALATGVQGDADSAADRAYRARLAAERASAMANQALEAADRAERIAQMAYTDAREAAAAAQEAYDLASRALSDAASQGEQARSEALRAMERAQRADQQAYRARLTAERALARVEELEDQVAVLAQRPVLGGELKVDYELTHTSNPPDGVKVDPRDSDSDTIKVRNALDLTVALKAAFQPAEGVNVEGGVTAKSSLFAASYSLSDMFVKVTTPGMLRMAYFGGVTGAQLAEGFNKYTLDADTYGAKVASADRRGGIIETQVGSLNSRVIVARLDGTNNLYGITAGLPLADGLNVRANYLWWTGAERVGSVQAYGETGGIKYDAIYALYKENPAVDVDLSTSIGVVDLGFNYRMVDEAFAPSNPADPKAADLPHMGKLLDEDDDDLLPDQRRYVLSAEAPIWGLTAFAEKGLHNREISNPNNDWTDWVRGGFKDLGLLGFKLGAQAYSDTRDHDRETQAVRVDLSREFQLGLPVTFTAAYANARLTNWTLGWDSQSHTALGLAVNDYALTDAISLSASVKTETNPIKDDKWTEPERWNWWTASGGDWKDDAGGYQIYYRDVAAVSAKFAATDALTLSAGYTQERVDTDNDAERDITVHTTNAGLDYTLNLAGTDVSIGYGYEYKAMVGGTYAASPKNTWTLGLKRELLGATWDASYKVVTGRGKDGAGKLDAVDQMASLDVTYPIAESIDFTLNGKWGQSDNNADASENYYYSSIKAGFGVKF